MIKTASENDTAPWLIVAGDFTQLGGMDKANYELAWYLADHQNQSVTLVSHRVAQPLASHKHIRVVSVPRPFGQHLLGQPLLDFAGRRAAARLVAQRPDARVLVNGANCRWPGINWVHMVHHACPADDAFTPVFSRMKNRFCSWLFRRQEAARIGKAQLVIANSQMTRKDILDATQISPQKVAVSYLGCDPKSLRPVLPDERATNRERLGLNQNRPVMGFVGALGYDRRKGFDTLLRACAKIRRDTNLRPFIVAAGGGKLNFWHQKIAARDLSEDVRLLGLVDNIPEVLAAIDILVSPTRYDAYGMGVHEALCRGIPAIVSSRAGIVERYPDSLQNLILSDPDCEEELSNRIIATLDNLKQIRTEVKQFGENLRTRSWNDMSADIVELVETHFSNSSNPHLNRQKLQPHISGSHLCQTVKNTRIEPAIHE